MQLLNPNIYRLIALKGALKLEILGMRRRGQSAYSILKRELGFKGNKQSVLAQLEEYLNQVRP